MAALDHTVSLTGDPTYGAPEFDSVASMFRAVPADSSDHGRAMAFAELIEDSRDSAQAKAAQRRAATERAAIAGEKQEKRARREAMEKRKAKRDTELKGPETVYRKYRATVKRAQSWDAFDEILTSSALQSSKQQGPGALEIVRALAPLADEVKDVRFRGAKATLTAEVTLENYYGSPFETRCEILLVKEAGAWRLHEEQCDLSGAKVLVH